ncbi:MAG: GntR family transcriptional regulator [Oscillospiraceae bacterium]|jgi:DNA-binding GntR family transcriptional regulator
MITKNVSLSDQVFERLENDILQGVYTRGEELVEQKICERLSVSRTPVREALRMLEQENLVENTGKGIFVLGITSEDALMMYEIRKRIEGMAAAGCARNLDKKDIDDLSEIVDLQEFYAGKGDSEKVKEMDSKFHEEIYSGCGSAVLKDTLTTLHRKLQKFRKRSVEDATRAKNSILEHRQVVEAIATGDPEKADRALTQHVTNAGKRLSQVLEKEGAGDNDV